MIALGGMPCSQGCMHRGGGGGEFRGVRFWRPPKAQYTHMAYGAFRREHTRLKTSVRCLNAIIEKL